jgi:ssDNA-binding replication factor A large subunit
MKTIKTFTATSGVELVKLIVEKTKKPEEEIWNLIEAKRKELDYLISEEGAAHIIASELGLNLKPTMRVDELEEGATGVEIFLRVTRAYPMREFKKGERQGKVLNVLAEDNTGTVRVSLWDKRAENEVKEGDVLYVSGGYVKKTKAGLEIRAGNRSTVELNPEKSPASLKGTRKASVEQRTLDQAKTGELVQINASLVRVKDRVPFFESAEGKQLMVSGLVEDDTGSMRAIFFRRAAEALMGIPREKAIEIADMSGYQELLAKVPVLKELKLYGKIKHNEMTNSDELIVSRVYPMKPGEEVDRKLEKILGIT